MKKTINRHFFITAFDLAGRADQFSRDARDSLYDYYSDLEADTGSEIELDVIAICCDWTEYASAVEAAEVYGWERKEPEDERADRSHYDALVFLHDNTTTLELPSGGVVVMNF